MRFERVGVLMFPANASERNSSDRTLRSFPCVSIYKFEKVVNVGSQHLKGGNGGSKLLLGTEEDSVLASGCGALHVGKTIKPGRIVPYIGS